MARIEIDPEKQSRLKGLCTKPRGHTVGVLGLGTSGRAMALFLCRRGAHVIGMDDNADLNLPELSEAAITLRLGGLTSTSLAEAEALAVSPGVGPEHPVVVAAHQRSLPVFGELELAGKLPAQSIAVTGTNGKSTTTALAAQLCRAMGLETFAGGNLGDPIVAWLDRHESKDVAVVEVSSFQLETAYSFAPAAAVVLNITPDHIDRYPDLDAYALAKRRLVENLAPGGVAVLNHDDPRVAAMAQHTAGRVVWFSTQDKQLAGDGVSLRGDTLVPHGSFQGLGELDLGHPRLLGEHNRQNALAAMVAVHALLPEQASAQALRRGYLEFEGLPHRLEVIAEVEGVRYINDSKATNDDAAAIALFALDAPVIMLLGGRGKGAGYKRVVEAAAGKVRLAVVFGEDAEQIDAALRGHVQVTRAASMAAALKEARKQSRPGDTVLLAPACASFDEFRNYRWRGDAFRRLVTTFKEQA